MLANLLLAIYDYSWLICKASIPPKLPINPCQMCSCKASQTSHHSLQLSLVWSPVLQCPWLHSLHWSGKVGCQDVFAVAVLGRDQLPYRQLDDVPSIHHHSQKMLNCSYVQIFCVYEEAYLLVVWSPADRKHAASEWVNEWVSEEWVNEWVSEWMDGLVSSGEWMSGEWVSGWMMAWEASQRSYRSAHQHCAHHYWHSIEKWRQGLE